MSHPERIFPDETEPGIVAIHQKRYEFALPFCAGKEVLDAGCGAGYGTVLLAEVARRVVGVDLDPGAVDYARQRYPATNVEFRQADLLALDSPDDSFDVVCSFEVIEHLPDVSGFLAEIRRIMRPDGLFLVSTPQAEETTRTPENPHHRVEFSRPDFEQLLRGHFGDVSVYGQRRLQTRRHRLLQRVDLLGLRRRLTFLRPAAKLLGTAPTADVTSDGIVISPDDLERASELVAVCRGPR